MPRYIWYTTCGMFSACACVWQDHRCVAPHRLPRIAAHVVLLGAHVVLGAWCFYTLYKLLG